MDVKGDMADKLRAACDQRERLAVTGLIDADLLDGEVTVAVEHSTVNHKTNRHSPRSVRLSGRRAAVRDPVPWSWS